ncbi:hypothetical protein [Novosphingobium olei]|uniref:Uncharacterized protein n=1 Tax=Novosphingobium olei TaxID=2728851 RepID=A0A7Y0BRX7_9SPHN|nr:hypothetical protein [Novosphingobium olei]NML94801.1 hypothetical protein [Novosphingobium olei]BEV00284.1 hypothetical protein NSDW_13780 [Novosphingobium olei]
METEQPEWLRVQNENKRRSRNLTKATFFAYLTLALIGCPIILIGTPLSPIEVAIFSIWFALVFIVAVFIIRPRTRVGSVSRYTCNIIATMTAIVSSLGCLAAIAR